MKSTMTRMLAAVAALGVLLATALVFAGSASAAPKPTYPVSSSSGAERPPELDSAVHRWSVLPLDVVQRTSA